MLDVYGVGGPAAEDLLRVAREARQKGWWQVYGTVLTGAYVGLEAAADEIRAFEALVVPGLLQTEDYARAMIGAARPDIDAREVEQRVRLRIERQSLLTQAHPATFWVVLDEAVLRRQVGGPDVMRRQLEHIMAMADQPNVIVQVLPFTVGAHAAMDGTFVILRYTEPADPDVVFTANAAGGMFLEKDDDLRRYALIFDQLRANALRADESVALISGLSKEQ